jgi:hypothetical protein
MKPITVVHPYSPAPWFRVICASLAQSTVVQDVIALSPEPGLPEIPGCRLMVGESPVSRRGLEAVLREVQTPFLLLVPYASHILFQPGGMERLVETAESTGAGLVYSDFYDESREGKTMHPLNDYQWGSVRDDFDFGAMMLFSVSAIRDALERHGPVPDVQYAGLYDLRLKLSIDHGIHHLPEPLYSVKATGNLSGGERLFAYVDPRNRAVQQEMEAVFTDHLKRIGAYISPGLLRNAGQPPHPFPVEASVVIPVRNRNNTIADAVGSALSQKTDFPFNVIVVDNHSTDGTTANLARLAADHPTLKHIIPVRTDLGIGGCWNEAIHSDACGRYAVQLDSDDLYSDTRTMQKIVHMLREGSCAMVVGSYTLVDERLEDIPPGLIDHREWTHENGHNNALRINGLGAPRAFDTAIMREIGFLNVSYGEDYAAALRICREYRIGRIFESLYLCRRWPGNTDADLTIEATNRNDAFKDWVRTEEIRQRQGVR